MEANEPKKEQNTEEMDVMKQFMELMGQQGMKELSQMKVKSEQQKKEPENQRPRVRKQVYKGLWKEQVAIYLLFPVMWLS